LQNIAAVIITHNEADNIARCLESLQKLATEILVVDSYSTDDTAAICEKQGVSVILHTWEGYAKTKNFANSKVDAEWILSIDADEVLSDELIQSIRSLSLKRGTVYSLDRNNYFCGQWIRHSGWYPDWKVRLFHKNDAYWTGNFVHEKLKYETGTSVQKLKGKLYHYSYKSHEEHRQRIRRYAALSAAELHQQGKAPNLLKTICSAIARFFRTLVLRGGFLDGKNGWIISYRNMHMQWLKYQELRRLNEKP
jgi:glycosyltransferase involved in cell wall biosynthesis